MGRIVVSFISQKSPSIGDCWRRRLGVFKTPSRYFLCPCPSFHHVVTTLATSRVSSGAGSISVGQLVKQVIDRQAVLVSECGDGRLLPVGKVNANLYRVGQFAVRVINQGTQRIGIAPGMPPRIVASIFARSFACLAPALPGIRAFRSGDVFAIMCPGIGKCVVQCATTMPPGTITKAGPEWLQTPPYSAIRRPSSVGQLPYIPLV